LVLDTPPEERFDKIARVGIQVGETGRDVSFCAHAILRNEIMTIDDALQDARLADRPATTPHCACRARVPATAPWSPSTASVAAPTSNTTWA